MGNRAQGLPFQSELAVEDAEETAGFSSLSDDVLSLILNKVDVQDSVTFLSLNLACKAFNRIASPSSPLWKKAFFGKKEPPQGTSELKGLEEEIGHFGGFKRLLGARLLTTTTSVISYPTKSMLFVMTTSEGMAFMWGGGMKEPPAKEEARSWSSGPPFTWRECQLRPLFQAADVDELIDQICPLYSEQRKIMAELPAGHQSKQQAMFSSRDTGTILLETFFFLEGHPGRLFHKMHARDLDCEVDSRNTSLRFFGFYSASRLVFRVPSCRFNSLVDCRLVIKRSIGPALPPRAGRQAEESRVRFEGACTFHCSMELFSPNERVEDFTAQLLLAGIPK